MAVAVFYGGLIFGLLPLGGFVSWEGHLFGLHWRRHTGLGQRQGTGVTARPVQGSYTSGYRVLLTVSNVMPSFTSGRGTSARGYPDRARKRHCHETGLQ